MKKPNLSAAVMAAWYAAYEPSNRWEAMYRATPHIIKI
jgi:hypothetical protein